MAVLDQLSVKIRSRGESLREYEVPADEPVDDLLLARCPTQHLTKYVKAVSGADYEIVCSVSEGFNFGNADSLCFRAYLDGKYSTGRYIMQKEYQVRNRASAKMVGTRGSIDGVWKRFPFHWGEIHTSEEMPNPTATEMKALHGTMGTIRVEVWRNSGTKPGQAAHRPFKFFAADEAIPEKALKGKDVDVATKSGIPYDVEAPSYYDCHRLDSKPIAGFLFKYRSKHALQIIGVIPRSPSPVPLEDRDPGDLNHEEAVELIRNQRAQIESAKIRVKEEENTKCVGIRVSAKREALDMGDDLIVIAGPRKKARHNIETIDLTHDS